jgi:FKBP-type peptidyl-prolyl cis-trans isomerase SlyD
MGELMNKPRFVSFHYTLKDKTGAELDTSRDGEPMMFLEGASQIIPGLESGIRELRTGDKKQIQILAADAYGARDESLVIEVSKTELPTKELRIGQQFRVSRPNQSPQVFRVTGLTPTHATLDANHPLAGEDLTFHVEITGTREATAQEIEHGHTHENGDHN